MSHLNNKLQVVGKLGSTYGIRGWLRVYSSTEIVEAIFSYQPWALKINRQWQSVEIEGFKQHNNEYIVKLKGINDRETAQHLANVEIGVDPALFPPLEEGDFYWHDLIGCSVVNLNGYHLGTVQELMETGSNDVLVIKANHQDAFGKQERLVPFLLNNVVKRVDLSQQIIEVDWDAGF